MRYLSRVYLTSTVLTTKSIILPGLLALASHVHICTAQTFDPNKAAPQDWVLSKIGTNKKTNTTFSNPVSTENDGDPFMTKDKSEGQEWYLYTFSTNDNITLKRSRSLTDNSDDAEARTVFNPDPKSADAVEPWSKSICAPEIHNISGKCYIIFTATPDGDNTPPLQDAICRINRRAVNHRMFVMESSGPDLWTSDFMIKSMLNTYDQFAIDGAYFSDRRMISAPDQPWEQVPYGRPVRLATKEGPQQLTNPQTGQNFVIYSAACVNTPFYCLGMLELVGNNPMQYQRWRKHEEGCVFYQNMQAGAYGPGHASLTTSPDGQEHYVAQTTPNPAAGLYRTARIQRFDWNEDGTPNFPLAENGPFPVPAGQRSWLVARGRP
ncbi:alpha-N-arab-like proteininofuranosidase [Apiospora arundinis]